MKLYLLGEHLILPFFLHIPRQNSATPEDWCMFLCNISDHPKSCTVTKPRRHHLINICHETKTGMSMSLWTFTAPLLMSTSCRFYWCTSMLNQNHIPAHQWIKCINLTNAFVKIRLVCWMNKCGNFTNLRIVDTLTYTVYMTFSIYFSSLNSQMTNTNTMPWKGSSVHCTYF